LALGPASVWNCHFGASVANAAEWAWTAEAAVKLPRTSRNFTMIKIRKKERVKGRMKVFGYVTNGG